MSHVSSVPCSPVGNSSETNVKHDSAQASNASFNLNQLRVAKYTNRCMSKTRPLWLAVIREYALRSPKAFASLTEFSVDGKRAIGMPCLSRQAMKDSRLAARISDCLIWSNEITHVAATGFAVSSKSSLRSSILAASLSLYI